MSLVLVVPAGEWVLAVGGIATISGRAKTQKTWCALDLCLSAATGDHSWLKFKVKRSKTVYVNLELSHKTLMFRIKAIAEAKGINLKDLGLRVLEWVNCGVFRAPKRAKTSRGAGFVLHSTRPHAVERSLDLQCLEFAL